MIPLRYRRDLKFEGIGDIRGCDGRVRNCLVCLKKISIKIWYMGQNKASQPEWGQNIDFPLFLYCGCCGWVVHYLNLFQLNNRLRLPFCFYCIYYDMITLKFETLPVRFSYICRMHIYIYVQTVHLPICLYQLLARSAYKTV